jgi:hypothetical protein
MSSDNPQRSVLLIGKSQLVLEDTVARLRHSRSSIGHVPPSRRVTQVDPRTHAE